MKVKLEFPKNSKALDYKEKIQSYLGEVLAIEELKKNEQVKKIFRLNYFYQQIKKEEDLYEVVNVPE